MDDGLRQQRDTSLAGLEALTRRGHQIRNVATVDVTRAWQEECGAAIHQLSGGSKAHWLARAYSDAFLVRSAQGGLVIEVDATEIVDRIFGVLAQGATSLSRMDDVAASSGAAPRARQFEFVHNAELRPVLEQTFADSCDALERGEFGLAVVLSCGVLEAVLTDALDHARPRAHDAPEGHVADWSFERRIAAAEDAGRPRSGLRAPAVRCAELPGSDRCRWRAPGGRDRFRARGPSRRSGAQGRHAGSRSGPIKIAPADIVGAGRTPCPHAPHRPSGKEISRAEKAR